MFYDLFGLLITTWTIWTIFEVNPGTLQLSSARNARCCCTTWRWKRLALNSSWWKTWRCPWAGAQEPASHGQPVHQSCRSALLCYYYIILYSIYICIIYCIVISNIVLYIYIFVYVYLHSIPCHCHCTAYIHGESNWQSHWRSFRKLGCGSLGTFLCATYPWHVGPFHFRANVRSAKQRIWKYLEALEIFRAWMVLVSLLKHLEPNTWGIGVWSAFLLHFSSFCCQVPVSVCWLLDHLAVARPPFCGWPAACGNQPWDLWRGRSWCHHQNLCPRWLLHIAALLFEKKWKNTWKRSPKTSILAVKNSCIIWRDSQFKKPRILVNAAFFRFIGHECHGHMVKFPVNCTVNCTFRSFFQATCGWLALCTPKAWCKNIAAENLFSLRKIWSRTAFAVFLSYRLFRSYLFRNFFRNLFIFIHIYWYFSLHTVRFC